MCSSKSFSSTSLISNQARFNWLHYERNRPKKITRETKRQRRKRRRMEWLKWALARALRNQGFGLVTCVNGYFASDWTFAHEDFRSTLNRVVECLVNRTECARRRTDKRINIRFDLKLKNGKKEYRCDSKIQMKWMVFFFVWPNVQRNANHTTEQSIVIYFYFCSFFFRSVSFCRAREIDGPANRRKVLACCDAENSQNSQVSLAFFFVLFIGFCSL